MGDFSAPALTAVDEKRVNEFDRRTRMKLLLNSDSENLTSQYNSRELFAKDVTSNTPDVMCLCKRNHDIKNFYPLNFIVNFNNLHYSW